MPFPRRQLALACWALPFAAVAAHGQMHHVDKPERVTRAVGVYEWTGDLAKPTAARFVPVSLFIDGHFEDAGLYLARPVPFALQTGDIYTIEHAGEPQGMLDLETAQRVVTGNALADDNPTGAWYAYGKFTPDAPPRPPAPLHRSAHLPTIQASSDPNRPHLSTGNTPDSGSPKGDSGTTDSDRPHMDRRNPDAGTTSPAGTGSQGSDKTTDGASQGQSAPGGSTGAGTGGSSRTDSSDDTDRPTLRRRDPSQDAGRSKAVVKGKAGSASVTAAGPQPGDDPDRPTLSHQTAAEEGTKELTGLPADLHQAVAVSDAASRDPHPFARPWEDATERANTLAALEALAKPRVAAYLAENRLVPGTDLAVEKAPTQNAEGTAANTENGAGGPPKLQRGKPQEYSATSAAPTPAPPKKAPVPSPARRAAHAAKPSGPAPLTLRDEQIAGYTLSYGGLPTFVYTAAVPAAAAPQADSLPTAAAHPTAFVTLVAQRLPSGELHVALTAVTDSTHLDRSPRLRLVDAVDPDASHRASLLFEMRGSSSRQFALYRLITAKAEMTFSTASIE